MFNYSIFFLALFTMRMLLWVIDQIHFISKVWGVILLLFFLIQFKISNFDFNIF